jgi:hypothetical protein
VNGARCWTRTSTALSGLEILSLHKSLILILSDSASSYSKSLETWTLPSKQPTLRSRMCEAPAFPVAPSWLLESQGTEHGMAKIKLTKRVVDAAAFGTRDYELRDTVVPGLLLKVTPAGGKIIMLQYRTNAGNRRKPTIGRFGELSRASSVDCSRLACRRPQRQRSKRGENGCTCRTERGGTVYKVH